jgi:enoyl-CoA hydratase/carnithine racemase
METVNFVRDGHVGWVRLNRPEKLNAFTIAMWEELRELGETLVADPDLRAVVVIGEGRAFSSGIDTSVFTDMSSSLAVQDDPRWAHADPIVRFILRTQRAFNWCEDAPFPTIAAVHGYALGGGLQLALACDLRIFARNAKVGLLETKYGILPDLGGTQRLPRVVGPGKAKELIFTAAIIDAEESLRIGLAERVVDDDALEAEAGALAAKIASQPPIAIRGAKRAVDASRTTPIHEGLIFEAEQQSPCMQSSDRIEALTAGLEGREPQYQGR